MVVDEAAGNVVAEAVSAAAHAGEAESLFGSMGSFVNVYGVVETRLLETYKETSSEVGSGSYNTCRKPATIMATGAFITLSTIIGLALNNELRIAYEKDLKNLNEYIK